MAKLFTNSKRTGQQVTTKYFRKQLDAMYHTHRNRHEGVTLNQLVSWCGERWTYTDGKRVEHQLIVDSMRNTYPTVGSLRLEYWTEPLPANLAGFKEVLGWLRELTPELFQERVKARQAKEAARQEAERIRVAEFARRKAEADEILRKAQQERERRERRIQNELKKLREIEETVSRHCAARELRISKEVWTTILKEPTLEEERNAVAAALHGVVKSSQVVVSTQSALKQPVAPGNLMLRHHMRFEDNQRVNNSKSTFRNHWVVPTEDIECFHGETLGLQLFDCELYVTDTHTVIKH